MIQYSNLHDPLRTEAEYYQKHYLALEKRLLSLPHQTLDNIREKITDGTHFTPEYTETGIPFLSALNVLENRLDFDVGHQFISPSAHHALYKRCNPRSGDVLLRKVGVGPRLATVVPNGLPEFSLFVSVALIRVNKEHLLPRFLSTFINCRMGQSQLIRIQKGMSQPDLHLEDIAKLLIPILSGNFQEKIEATVRLAESLVKESSVKFSQAEAILLNRLGLKNWQPPEPLTYTRLASDASAAGRLDAEHFQPKYRAMIEITSQHAVRVRRVDEFAIHCDRGAQPIYDVAGELAVVNSRHILEGGLDYDNLERTDITYWNESKFIASRIYQNDILTYTTGAKVGRTVAYFDTRRALASNHVNLLRIEGENPFYVATVINSMIGRLQTRMMVTGSAQVELYPADIRSFTIPFVDKITEKKIEQTVRSTHAARRQAQALLDAAKRAVEIAIEDSEAAAMDYLKKMDSEYGCQPSPSI